MYRSSSVNRSLDGSVVSPLQMKKITSTPGVDLLPRYTQLTDEREKKQSRFTAEHSVHFIPVVLILCGLVLWLAGGAQYEDFARSRHDELIMNKSSTIGEGLKEKEEMIPNFSDVKKLNNGSIDGESTTVKDS
ncbi:hypothetical protein KI387_033578 [Taxus chinensis]|uniref:Transmembrane protein n=1 Tax=Taxus chinensis TaxID=29808 RepID=A0AA38BTD8_TAXCH|nr:hypothetical protein KI387_033578 [Taxus chinensis]